MLKILYYSYDKLIIIKRSVILMIIQRKDYIDKINPFINKHIIKVLIGTRRSGKSTILKQIIDSLIN